MLDKCIRFVVVGGVLNLDPLPGKGEAMDSSPRNAPVNAGIIGQMRLALAKSKVPKKSRRWYLVWAKRYLGFLRSRDDLRQPSPLGTAHYLLASRHKQSGEWGPG